MANDPTRLISHAVSPDDLTHISRQITERIKQQGDKPYATVAYQLELLAQLQEFDLGRYLLQNRGVNGFWTHYILTYPQNKDHLSLTPLEKFLLERAPIILATQQRFAIFLEENQKQVHNHAKLASIPCGLIGELLYLNYDSAQNIDLVGIDYDAHILTEAKTLAAKINNTLPIKLHQQDAWDLKFEDEFNLISSNGLNVYESDNEKVTDLYRQFYKSLKPSGKLVTSFLTFPPNLTDKCEWDFSKINQQDMLLQKIIMVDIVDAKWQCYRSSEQTYQQLKTAGFEDIQFMYDDAKLFPTVVAYKK